MVQYYNFSSFIFLFIQLPNCQQCKIVANFDALHQAHPLHSQSTQCRTFAADGSILYRNCSCHGVAYDVHISFYQVRPLTFLCSNYSGSLPIYDKELRSRCLCRWITWRRRATSEDLKLGGRVGEAAFSKVNGFQSLKLTRPSTKDHCLLAL